MMTQVSAKVRVEDGPARKKEFATPDVMEKLKSHYKIGGVDALGKPILAGKPFDYLDWPSPYVWYIYKMDDKGIYQPHGVKATEAEALAFAKTL